MKVNPVILGKCLLCKEYVEFDDQAWWERFKGEEYLLHNDCLLDAWCDNVDLNLYVEKEYDTII